MFEYSCLSRSSTLISLSRKPWISNLSVLLQRKRNKHFFFWLFLVLPTGAYTRFFAADRNCRLYQWNINGQSIGSIQRSLLPVLKLDLRTLHHVRLGPYPHGWLVHRCRPFHGLGELFLPDSVARTKYRVIFVSWFSRGSLLSERTACGPSRKQDRMVNIVAGSGLWETAGSRMALLFDQRAGDLFGFIVDGGREKEQVCAFFGLDACASGPGCPW